MIPKRFAARLTAVLATLVLVATISAGAYYDAGGWGAVAVVWGGAAALMGMVWAGIWGIENWNAR
ncbi:hypothetical protein [Streptomyces sp. NPDC096153]|uniref:hypothetical protein n=1 Tax=Streptomyces sp. NPDC096153 TaxID=3155548 RepID=UPI00331E42E1